MFVVRTELRDGLTARGMTPCRQCDEATLSGNLDFPSYSFLSCHDTAIIPASQSVINGDFRFYFLGEVLGDSDGILSYILPDCCYRVVHGLPHFLRPFTRRTVTIVNPIRHVVRRWLPWLRAWLRLVDRYLWRWLRCNNLYGVVKRWRDGLVFLICTKDSRRRYDLLMSPFGIPYHVRSDCRTGHR